MVNKKEIKYWKILIGVFFVYYLIYYLPYLVDGLAIRGDDFNWEWGQRSFSFNFKGGWNAFGDLLGSVYPGPRYDPSDLWIEIFPGVFSTNTLFMFMFSLMVWGSYLFFRSWDINRIPALCAGVFIAFSPNFHTFIRTGHIDKIILSPFIMFSLAFITMMFRKSQFRWGHAFFTALSLSFAFTDGDPQLFLFFAPFFSLYALGLLFTDHRISEKDEIEETTQKKDFKTYFHILKHNLISNRKLIPLFILIPVLAIGMSLSGLESNLSRLTSSQNEQAATGEKLIPLSDGEENETAPPISQEETKDDLQNWYWATQWSLPKLETLDILIPGFFGYLTGSPTEPYWGKVGQSEGWEQHRQGYQNYSLMISYLGVFLIIFLIYGLLYCHPIVRVSGAVLLILFLFLSYGKFFFVYRWLYDLPYMSELRNPNRFLQLFHFVASIVFGFGLSHYYERIRGQLRGGSPKNHFNFFLIFFGVVMGIGVLGWIGLFSEEDQLLAYFGARFNYQTATLIISNMFYYWIKAMIVFSIACLLLYFTTQKINLKNYKIWIGAILLFGLLDMYEVNKKFYWYEKPELLETNFHRLLKGELPGYEQYNGDDPQDSRRMFFLKNNGGVNGQYYSFLYYNGKLPLKLIEYNIVRKYEDIPKKNRNFIETLINPDLRRLKVAGVRYVFSGSPVHHPQLSLVYMDEIESIDERVFLYEFTNALPFLYIRGKAEFGDSLSSTLGRMNQDDFDLEQSVMLHEGLKTVLTDEQLTALVPHPDNKIWIKERIFESKGNSPHSGQSRYLIGTDLKTPVILIMNNAYHQYWKAESRGELLPHFPANYFFNAFYLTPEDKEVEVFFDYGNIRSILFSINAFLRYIFLLGVLIFIFLKKSQLFKKTLTQK